MRLGEHLGFLRLFVFQRTRWRGKPRSAPDNTAQGSAQKANYIKELQCLFFRFFFVFDTHLFFFLL